MLTRTMEAGRLSFRTPVTNDGSSIHALVKRCKPLDLNSRYCYLTLCKHFSSTCAVVAENDQWLPLSSPTSCRRSVIRCLSGSWLLMLAFAVRAWQKKMLRHLLSRHNLKRIRYVEATVNPSNDAARALFKSLGKDCACSVDEELIFHASMFGNESHEQESLIRVGPINPVCKTLIGRKDYL